MDMGFEIITVLLYRITAKTNRATGEDFLFNSGSIRPTIDIPK